MVPLNITHALNICIVLWYITLVSIPVVCCNLSLNLKAIILFHNERLSQKPSPENFGEMSIKVFYVKRVLEMCFFSHEVKTNCLTSFPQEGKKKYDINFRVKSIPITKQTVGTRSPTCVRHMGKHIKNTSCQPNIRASM